MYSANHLLQLRRTKLSVIVMSAIFSFACAGSVAAEPGATVGPKPSSPSSREEAAGLKLDLGLAINGNDCEDDYADLMHAASASGSSAPAVAPLPSGVSTNGAFHAKLAPAENFTPSSEPNAAQKTAVPMIPASAMKRVAPAASPVLAASVVPAAYTAPAAPAAVTTPASSWEIVPSDKTLNTALARWAAAAGWQLVWELPVDYAVDVRTEIRGGFMEAVELVAKSMETAEVPMKAIFYEGNRVLRIVAKGTE